MPKQTRQGPPPKHAQCPILMVDDNPVSLQLVEVTLRCAGYENLIGTNNPSEAVELVAKHQPDLVLLDLHMPEMSGLDLLAQLGERLSPSERMPILVFTGDDTPEARIQALELGANDFLLKPGDFTEILLRVGNFLELRHCQKQLLRQQVALEELVAERTSELVASRQEIIRRLAQAAEFKDDDSGEHCERVSLLACDIAKEMGLNCRQANLLRMAAPLHDIGKVGVPDSLLLKSGPLTPEEYGLVKMHVDVGARILSNSTSPILQLAEEIARSHHEHWDGTGYPEGLKGLDIPLGARIVAVADTYDTLVSERPYRTAWTHEAAVEQIAEDSGTKFDPEVVLAFLNLAKSSVREAKAA